MTQKALEKSVIQAALDAVAKHGTRAAAARSLGIPAGTLDNHLQAGKVRGMKAAKSAKPDPRAGLPVERIDELHAKIISATGVRRYVITAAQNATPVHSAFLASLLGYCKHENAQLIVIPYRYHNPTSMWGEKAQTDDWWADELAPYLYDRRVKLNKNLVLLGDIKTQPTANSPLQGFESITGPRSAIIGHPKLELTTVPTPQQKLAKILTTTGAVTKRNYTPTKAGKKGEFHHTYGACVVEIDGSAFHLRQLNAIKDGSFMDLRHEYRGGTRRDTGGIAGLVLGDEHEEFIEPKVEAATFGKGGLVDELRPEYIVSHDIHDFYSRNHHHIGQPFIDYAKHHAGADNVKTTLLKTFEYARRTTPAWATRVFVSSNHPDALAQWVKRARWQDDPRNAEFLLETALVMVRGTKMGETGAKTIDPFLYWGEQMLPEPNFLFLEPDQSFQIEGIECGYHGHYGLNGARGNRRSFARIGTKVVIGHGHSPGINEGAYQTGTKSRLKLEYVRGPSSWLHTDCAIYKNGKRSLITIIDGRYHA